MYKILSLLSNENDSGKNVKHRIMKLIYTVLDYICIYI